MTDSRLPGKHKMEKSSSKLLTIAEAAMRLGVSTRSVRRFVDRQELAVVRLSARLVRITPPALADFVARSNEYSG